MSTSENLLWLKHNDLVDFLKSVHRGDFYPCHHRKLTLVESHFFKLLSDKGLVRSESGGYFVVESGWLVLEAVEALGWVNLV